MSSHKTKLLIVIAAIFLAGMYVPLFLNGGIIVDDWGDISHNLSCPSFIECYRAWFPLFSNRPLAPLPITALTFIFADHYAGYLIANFLIYLFAVILFSKVLAVLCNYSSAIFFSTLALIPIIAMPVIASPINQSTATLAFLFWSLSITSLFKYVNKKNVSSYILSFLWLLAAFLTYEVILPLILLNVLLPFVIIPQDLSSKPFNYIVKFAIPVLLVLILTALWQKGIAPQFMEVDSRLKFSPSNIIPKFHTWAHVFYAQIPQLFWKCFGYLNLYSLATGFLSIILFWKCAYLRDEINNFSLRIRFALVCALCFVASSLIFILSNESAVSSGYQARGLSSTWFTFILLLASLMGAIKQKSSLFTGLLIAFGFFSSLSFSAQRDQYINSWNLQRLIISDVSDLIHEKGVPKNATVIGNVPKYLANNYNDEIVFSQPWDFGAALALTTNLHIADGFPIDTRKNDFRQIRISENVVSGQNWVGSNFQNLWFYDFDPSSHKGSLVRIKGAKELQEVLAGIK